jgi:predicted HTH transcriptional regulator
LNFSKIPLCCRTFFFDQERILPGEDKVTEYKSYKFPFNPISFETFKKTICGFLNCCGGDIYIGVKETTNKKYRYVLGNYLTENDKEELIKTFRKIG